jgi:phosphoserine aminotransferase
MKNRVHNFYAGPGALPLPVLERVHAEFFNYNGTGMGVMELSHRTPEIQHIIDDSAERVKRMMGLSDEFEAIFLQGGGSMQFLMAPMNLSHPGDQIDYIDTGYWAEKAIKAAKALGRDLKIVFSSADRNHTYVPRSRDIPTRPGAKYLHLCTNNTVVGTQFKKFPDVPVPIIADMSSDFLSKVIDPSSCACIYAHAQKNVGLSGVTAVIIRKSVLENSPSDIPELLDYRTHITRKSNYHTPPCFSIYVMWHILRWLEEDIGGVEAMEKINQKKSSILYDFIDATPLFDCPVERDSRSRMNVVFNLPTESLEQQFIHEAAEVGLIGVAGHRTKGGCRISLYNAVTLEAVESLIEFMDRFSKKVSSPQPA